MKKLLLLAVAVVMSANIASSQVPPVKYQEELDFGYSLGVGLLPFDRVYLHTIQAAKIGDYFSVGIGTGFDMYYMEGSVYLPLYLDLAGYLPTSSRNSLIFSFDIGTCLDLDDRHSWLYVTPAFGIKTGMFKIQLGYNIWKYSRVLGLPSIDALQLKMGIVF